MDGVVVSRADARERHERCRHARACRRVLCLPTVAVVALGIKESGVISEALLCDCCTSYERRDGARDDG